MQYHVTSLLGWKVCYFESFGNSSITVTSYYIYRFVTFFCVYTLSRMMVVVETDKVVQVFIAYSDF